jgi:hypothetical protein
VISDRVDCLMVINTLVTAATWFEWGYNKRNLRHMTQIGVTPVRHFLFLRRWLQFREIAATKTDDNSDLSSDVMAPTY